MRKIFLGLLALTAVVTSITLTSSPASAAVDRRPCVSVAEYRAVHSPMTPAKVRSIFDINGVQIDAYYDGYWEGDWVEDGYWSEVYDENWNVIDFEWVDMSYWDDYAYWVNQIDTVRSYKKCAGFDGGRGRVGINFDNYTSVYAGMRMYTKVRNNPAQLISLYNNDEWWRSAPSTRGVQPEAPEGAKDRGQDTPRPPKPESQPTTPKPEVKN